MCLRLIIGDQCIEDTITSNSSIAQNQNTILNSQLPPAIFCNIVLKLTSFLIQALGQVIKKIYNFILNFFFFFYKF